jgi:hypothetical protein
LTAGRIWAPSVIPVAEAEAAGRGLTLEILVEFASKDIKFGKKEISSRMIILFTIFLLPFPGEKGIFESPEESDLG